MHGKRGNFYGRSSSEKTFVLSLNTRPLELAESMEMYLLEKVRCVLGLVKQKMNDNGLFCIP